jgi:peptidoglycan DL-endopeptidase CwlO
VGTRLAGRLARSRRSTAAAAAALLVVAGLLTALTVNAGATPRPTVTQVQDKVNQLTTQYNKVTEQLDQVDAQLTSAQQQLKQVTVNYNHAETQFHAAQLTVSQIAASAYEDTGSTSIAGVLTSGNPQQVLQEGSLLLQLSSSRSDETQQLLAAASQLNGVQQEMQRTEDGIASLRSELGSRKNSLNKLINVEKATLASLTYQQQQQVTTGTLGGGTTGNGGQAGNTNPNTPPPNLPSGSQADAAVTFIFSQLGCPYVYGGTGPCKYGYDCSGLVQAAWAAAGVAIPRDTYSDWAALPHIPMSDLQPGDLIEYNGESHVAMYVGGGMIIDAPMTGMDVEEIPESTPWYADNADGALAP